MVKGHLRIVSPSIVNGTVPPKRRANALLRTREYLTEAEVERLIKPRATATVSGTPR